MAADRFGSKKVFTLGALTAVLWPLPMFALVNTGSVGLALFAFIVAAVVQGIMAGAQGGLFTEIFDVRIRYSGISIAYQLGGMIGGAITPIAAKRGKSSGGTVKSASRIIRMSPVAFSKPSRIASALPMPG